MSASEFDDQLFDMVSASIQAGTVIMTLTSKRLNRITSVDRAGILVETERSLARDAGPQRVPAWMIATAWERLRDNGELSQQELLNDLNVKRSAFVCALLAKGPCPHVVDTGFVVMRLRAA